MSEKINQIIEDLKTLTLLEASELVTAIEETFGVDASAAAGGSFRAPRGIWSVRGLYARDSSRRSE